METLTLPHDANAARTRSDRRGKVKSGFAQASAKVVLTSASAESPLLPPFAANCTRDSCVGGATGPGGRIDRSGAVGAGFSRLGRKRSLEQRQLAATYARRDAAVASAFWTGL